MDAARVRTFVFLMYLHCWFSVVHICTYFVKVTFDSTRPESVNLNGERNMATASGCGGDDDGGGGHAHKPITDIINWMKL